MLALSITTVSSTSLVRQRVMHNNYFYRAFDEKISLYQAKKHRSAPRGCDGNVAFPCKSTAFWSLCRIKLVIGH